MALVVLDIAISDSKFLQVLILHGGIGDGQWDIHDIARVQRPLDHHALTQVHEATSCCFSLTNPNSIKQAYRHTWIQWKWLRPEVRATPDECTMDLATQTDRGFRINDSLGFGIDFEPVLYNMLWSDPIADDPTPKNTFGSMLRRHFERKPDIIERGVLLLPKFRSKNGRSVHSFK
eukprot:5660947-Amphidinium_carterae.1